MNRFRFLAAALTLAAASACKDSPPPKSVPGPTSGTLKPEVKTPTEVSVLPPVAPGESATDVFNFNGMSHLGQCEVNHFDLGRGLLESGLIDDGIDELERGVFDTPDDPGLRRLLGQAYRGTGELELAVGHLRASVEQEDHAATWQLLAQTYFELRAYEPSIAALSKVTKLEPSSAEPYRLLAKVYQSRNMWKESVEASEEAIARGSDSPWTYNNMGYAYLVLGRYEDAVRELEKAVSFDSGVSPQIWNNLGLAYEKKGDLRDAHDAYLAALAGNPNYVKAKVNAQRTVQLAKTQGVDLGTRTADISRSAMTPVPVGTPEGVEPAFEIPAEPLE